MQVGSTSQANPNLDRKTRHEADADDDELDMDAAPAAPLDVYSLLEYRPSFMSGSTTEHWLAFRPIQL
jgi:hypothetical protein